MMGRMAETQMNGGDDPALDGERLAGNARPGRGGVAAAAEVGGDFVDTVPGLLVGIEDFRQPDPRDSSQELLQRLP